MLPWLASFLAQNGDVDGALRLLTFQTTRVGGAMMTALFIALLIGRPIIGWLRASQKQGQPIREDGPAGHLLTKKGTPTMGGAMILLSLALSTLLWADLSNPYVWTVLFVTAGYGSIGFLDDFLKVSQQNPRGLNGSLKLIGQVVIGIGACVLITMLSPEALKNKVAFPFFKDLLLNLGWFFPFFGLFVIVGASNAVNLTDGLDGLAIGPIMIAAAAFGIISYAVGRVDFSAYLVVHHVPGSGELAVLCAALIGAGLGFLWFNAPPAEVFMGDTGSLAAGGMLGTVAVILKHEMVLAIVGGLFVAETLSVIIQVASYRLTGKRVFLMAPFHHHFEKMGWKEPTIVIRFWIIAIVLAMIGLATLKIR